MKRPFSHFIQHDAMDCGPTCLRMVAAHYGRRYSLEGLREKAHLSREGVSMLGISEAAENIGFRTLDGTPVAFSSVCLGYVENKKHRQNSFLV
jgi:ATP-binding cassette subfamily B protein